MKKLMTTVAVLGCAVVMVSAQTVTSANMVGYAKNAMPAGGLLLASPAQFAGTAGGVTLDETFSGVVGGEIVYVFNGAAYDPYTYYVAYGWLNAAFGAAGDTVLAEGTSVWITGATGAETIMSGEVPSASSVTVTIAAGFSLIANPYPVALALDDIDLTSFVGGEIIYVFNGTAYDPYTYYTAYGWLNAAFGAAGNVQIPVGAGFWLDAVGSGSIVFNKLF